PRGGWPCRPRTGPPPASRGSQRRHQHRRTSPPRSSSLPSKWRRRPTPAVRRAVLATATRSLVAAGVLSDGTGDSGLQLLDPDGPLGLSVAHDLLVTVERSEP